MTHIQGRYYNTQKCILMWPRRLHFKKRMLERPSYLALMLGYLGTGKWRPTFPRWLSGYLACHGRRERDRETPYPSHIKIPGRVSLRLWEPLRSYLTQVILQFLARNIAIKKGERECERLGLYSQGRSWAVEWAWQQELPSALFTRGILSEFSYIQITVRVFSFSHRSSLLLPWFPQKKQEACMNSVKN